MFTDYHVHTEFSDDSDYLMEDVIKDAIKMNMDEICFTDHVDYGIKRDFDDPRGMLYRKGGPGEPEKMPLANVDYPKYFEKIALLKKKYPEIVIKQGMEFGVQMHTIDLYQKLFNRYSFDFIILSCHQVEDKEFWTQDFQRGRTQQEYNERYYKEILDVIKNYKDYSVLGHLDLISRYDENGPYPFEKIKPMIQEILEIVIPMMATVMIVASGGTLAPLAKATVDLINNLVFVTSCAVYVSDIQNARSVDETIDAIFGLCNEMVSFTIGELVGKSNVDEILGYIDSGLGSNLSGFVYELSQQISTDIGKMVWKWLQGEK